MVALAMMAVLAATAATLFSYTASNSRAASRSDATQKAYAGAESGVNSAVAMLGLGTNNALDPCLLHPPTNPSGFACASSRSVHDLGRRRDRHLLRHVRRDAAVVDDHVLRVVPQPDRPDRRAGEAHDARDVPITANQNDPANTAIWNYIISTKTSNSTTCDMWLQNTVQIDEPLFVAGNLCMNNSAQVLQPGSTAVKLVTMGKLILMSPQTSVGTSSQPIYEANVGGGCGTSITNTTHTCTVSDKVYASTLKNTASPISLPVVDDANAYMSAKPGPKNPCSITSGTPPVWDNDGCSTSSATRTEACPAAFNLTPGTNYTCEATDGARQHRRPARLEQHDEDC